MPFHGLAPPTEGVVLPAQAESCLCWLHSPTRQTRKLSLSPLLGRRPPFLCVVLCVISVLYHPFLLILVPYINVVLFLAHQDFQIVAVPGFPHALLCYWWGLARRGWLISYCTSGLKDPGLVLWKFFCKFLCFA